jgi:hypothetical protein
MNKEHEPRIEFDSESDVYSIKAKIYEYMDGDDLSGEDVEALALAIASIPQMDIADLVRLLSKDRKVTLSEKAVLEISEMIREEIEDQDLR